MGIAIWLAGVSVKDFACHLVKQSPYVSSEESQLFNQTMQEYLLKASALAVLIAGLIHYLFVKKLLFPFRQLSHATRAMAKGEYPAPLTISTQDEIGRLTSDFNYLSQRLKQTEELRKKMVSDIAHELRTPLTNINGYLEALSVGMMEGSKEIYKSLHEESQRITRLVEQLHELNVWESREISGKTRSAVSMKQIIQASIDSFALEFKNHGIDINANIGDCMIYGDRDGLMQVMINLLKNVLQYDRGGWVNLEGRMDEKNFYQVTVTNFGIPIPSEEKEHIFERFYRLDPSRSRESGGAGLGLALVKEIIEQHNGEVGLVTKEETHSFWFTIPIQ